MNRRQFLAGAASLGVIGVWATRSAAAAASSRVVWREDRASFPQGVASGDPDDHSVVLWTRRPFELGDSQALTVEVARDADFREVVAKARLPVLAAADWTCRALVGGLMPATTYWYRFTDDSGAGSRVGRTITAPRDADPRPVRFAFVSCNSVNEGAQNAFQAGLRPSSW
jgi:alkaline phosphatase D